MSHSHPFFDSNTRPMVILRHCDSYDVARITEIVSEGLATLSLKPHGKTLVKPNIVAAGKHFPYAYTRPEVAEGVLRALLAAAGGQTSESGMSELAIGERCGITIPTRLAFSHAGYDEMLTHLPQVKRYLFEEVPQVEVRYSHPERLRDYVYTPEPIAKADFFVNMPKFKSHPWTTVTFSMKNYIGIQDDRHRLIDHDHRLNEKIADLQYIIQPKLIVIDAIMAGEGRMLTPKPRRLSMIIMGNNQVAIDSVCCAIIGVQATDVEHIRLAAQRGFGPTDLNQIDMSGDVTLAEAQQRASGFEVGLVRVEKYFEGSKITAYAGPPPEAERTNYCWGGCPGAIEEAIEILRQFDKHCDEKMQRMHVVFGAYTGKIEAKPGEMVVFIGDCAQWQGEINGEVVDIPNIYQPRGTKDPHLAKHDDIYAKMLKVFRAVQKNNKDTTYIRLSGCPVSVAEQVLVLSMLGGVKNPFFDPSEGVSFNKAYLQWRLSTLWRRVRGEKYQKSGPCSRGQAAPNC